MEKLKFKMPMFGNAKILNSNEWKNENQELQCLEKLTLRIPVFGKA